MTTTENFADFIDYLSLSMLSGRHRREAAASISPGPQSQPIYLRVDLNLGVPVLEIKERYPLAGRTDYTNKRRPARRG